MLQTKWNNVEKNKQNICMIIKYTNICYISIIKHFLLNIF